MKPLKISNKLKNQAQEKYKQKSQKWIYLKHFQKNCRLLMVLNLKILNMKLLKINFIKKNNNKVNQKLKSLK